ncbi:MAG: NADH-quinone oxidoreductase subunit C [bacterium]|nr:NADH-quinone oxidoreductase subunit C [bacterium]
MNLSEIKLENLIGAVAAKRASGYRFVTITCSDLGDAFDLLYHFDKELKLETLRVRLPKGAELPSISAEYFAALLVENEIKDLFGIAVAGMLLDYQGRFLLPEDAPRNPWRRPSGDADPGAAPRKEGSDHE